MLELIPVNGHILVEMPAKKSKNNGVYIPDDIKDSIQTGKVIAVARDVHSGIRVGDTARWEKYAEADGSFEHYGKTVCLVKADQVMGIFREAKKNDT